MSANGGRYLRDDDTLRSLVGECSMRQWMWGESDARVGRGEREGCLCNGDDAMEVIDINRTDMDNGDVTTKL